MRVLAGFLCCMLVLSGCASVENLGPKRTRDTSSSDTQISILEDGVAQNEALVEREAEISQAILDALTPESDADVDPAAERFDLSVNGVPSQEFFRGLVRGTPYNIVVHPDVAGTVSLDLGGVTVSEVMEVMRDVYGYDYYLEENLFRVYPDALRTEVFQVDYLNVERSGRSEMQVSTGTLSDSGSNGGQTGFIGGASVYSPDGQGSNSGNVLGTVVNTDAKTHFWEELGSTLQSIVSGDEGSSVVVTPQVGLAVVRAKPESLHAVRTYIAQVESTLHRQVIIEAKILEVTLREGFEAGVNWRTFSEDAAEIDPGLGTFLPNDDVAGRIRSGDADIFNPLDTSFTLLGSYKDFDYAIDLLSTQGTVQVLSSPRISTVNNQKAVIKVGQDEFFVTDISTNTITAGSSINTNDSPELTPFFSGIALDVTPQISDTGEVILHIHPSISKVEEQRKIIGGESVPLAASTIRESDSIVRARDGQLVVIGGLMEDAANDDNGGVPFFKDIPGVGHLFKQKGQSSIKSELVILLKPIIVTKESQIDAMNQSLDNFRRLREALGRPG